MSPIYQLLSSHHVPYNALEHSIPPLGTCMVLAVSCPGYASCFLSTLFSARRAVIPKRLSFGGDLPAAGWSRSVNKVALYGS